MAFNFQTLNQLPMMTSDNSQGLGVSGNRAMFNLPRFQTPGTNVNFGGDVQPGGLKFSVSRTASSDPVQNILNDIANPLGGTNVNLNTGPQQPQQSALKAKMVNSLASNTPPSPYPLVAQAADAGFGFGASERPDQLATLVAGLGYTPQPQAPFGLRGAMLQPRQRPPLTSEIFY